MILKAANLFEVWLKLNETFVDYNHPNSLHWNPGRQTYYLTIPELLIQARSPEVPSLYLEDLGYAPGGQKIRVLLNKYLDPTQVLGWLADIGRWSNFDSPIYLPTRDPKNLKGNCIIGFSYKNAPYSCLTVFYRAMEMPSKAGADFFLIASLARMIGELTDKPIPVVRIFADAAWITHRTARIYLMYSRRKVKYTNATFNKVVQEGWRTYFLKGEPFSSTSGRNMQRHYQRLKEGLKKRIDQNVFHKKLEDYLEESR